MHINFAILLFMFAFISLVFTTLYIFAEHVPEFINCKNCELNDSNNLVESKNKIRTICAEIIILLYASEAMINAFLSDPIIHSIALI